jgi:exopolyphosphatase/guanosine-5'-triphosphate,3'-diphosphate pyrophosphatase
MTRLAAIDVGTNSVRLYVADTKDGSLLPIDRDLIITRLGEGVDRTGALGAEPMRRTLEAITGYHRRAVEAGATTVRIGATSAMRDASNREEILGAIRDGTGVTPEVLSGEDEARLAYLGATNELSEGGPFLVLDIGGGSTEFVLGEREVKSWISLDVGSVRLTERHVHADPPPEHQLAALRSDAARAVEEARRAVGSGAHTLVGLAGTITTVAAIALELHGYDRSAIHHARLDRARIGSIASAPTSMTSADRARLPAMPRGREDVIVAGAEILAQVMDGFGFSEVLVSEADILDGLLLDIA